MTESKRPYGAPQPEPIDDDEDRMGSMEELHFDEQEPATPIGDQASRARKPGTNAASTADHGSAEDDMTAQTLILEDGARDASEAGETTPADWDLSIVDEDEIGAGNGLDEAQLAEKDPVDGNR